MKRIISIVISLTLVSACGDNAVYNSLQDIEQLLETDVVAADSMLSTIPLSGSRKDRALYAILKTQADYKNNVIAQDDSLILTATEYYGTKKRDYHAAMAWYSLGCVYSDMGNDPEAINAYLKAKSLFPDTLVRYYALTEQNLGQHYEPDDV